MLGMSAAVERLERAIEAQEPVLLYGDYDVDGTSAVVLLKTAIEMLGGKVSFHVPHRLREGYGMQSSVLEAAYAEGVRMVVTVDTGNARGCRGSDGEAAGAGPDYYRPPSAGCGRRDPRVSQAILESQSEGMHLSRKGAVRSGDCDEAGAGAAGTARPGADAGEAAAEFFEDGGDCDDCRRGAAASGENRTIAALGLRELRRPAGAGLRALFAVAGLDPASKELTGYDVGFRLAPRINAAGRMDIAGRSN